MVAELGNLEQLLLKDNDDDHYLRLDVDDEAAEETISLCDLVVESNSAEDYNASTTSDFSREEQRSSDQDDFFEFFSEDFTASSITHPKDDIIFCGKLIPYKGNAVPEQTQITNTTEQRLEKRRSFPWKSCSFNKARTGPSNPQQQEKCTSYRRAVTQKYEFGTYRSYEYDFPVKKVSTLATPAAKSSRWYFFAFGYGRFPAEMDLRDIKNRQSRRNPSATMFRLSGGRGGEMIKKNEKRSTGKSLWRLLRNLGCKSQQANAELKASFGCFPQVCENRSASAGQDY